MCPMPMKPRPGFKWSSSIFIAIPFFHLKCSVMPPRHPPENLLLYKSEVRGRVWSLSPFPRPSTTGVDPRGAHPTPTSIQRVRGEVSVHLLACHFPSLPISGFAPVGRAAGKEHALEAVLL